MSPKRTQRLAAEKERLAEELAVAREKKLLELMEALRQGTQGSLQELDLRWQRVLGQTNDEVKTVRAELVSAQTHTLKEHQRRLSEMNAAREQRAQAQGSARSVKEQLELVDSKAEQQHAACVDRLVKLETAAGCVPPKRSIRYHFLRHFFRSTFWADLV